MRPGLAVLAAREAASGAATAAAVSIVEHFPGRGERKDDAQHDSEDDKTSH